MTGFIGIDELTRRVAAYGLPGQPAAIGHEQPSDSTWTQLLARTRKHRISGFLMAAVDAEALPLTDEQREQAGALHLEACTAVLRLEHRLLALTETLEAADVEVVVLKGSAYAHLVYPDPGLRSFRDVDLLVRGEQLTTAIEVLTARGALRQSSERRPGFERRFGTSVTLEEPDGTEIDLERTLLVGTFGFRIDTDELFATTSGFELGGRQLRALGPEARLLHGCYHALLSGSNPRLSSVRDLGQMLLTGEHDPGAVLDLADQWDSVGLMARSIQHCRDALGIEVEGELAEAVAAHRITRKEIRAIASSTGPDTSHTAMVLASLPFVDGVRDKVALLVGWVFPAAGFVGDRQGRFAWLGRGLRSFRRRLRPAAPPTDVDQDR